MKLSSTMALLSSLLSLASAQVYNITNSCPEEVNFYYQGQPEHTVKSMGNYLVNHPGNAGPIYTNYNGGLPSGSNTTRFYVYEHDEVTYYYIVRGNPFNTGVGLGPTTGTQTPANGCESIACNSDSCNTAFPSDKALAPPPPADGVAPTSPLFSCRGTGLNFVVNFCPDLKFPNEITGREIHPGGSPKKCLDVKHAVFQNGTPVQIQDCNGTPAQKWVIDHGLTKVRLAGTNFCLDKTKAPGNGVGLKIWQCYENLFAQTWDFNAHSQISSEGQCVDLKDGVTDNGRQLQTWECGTGNTNQVWGI